LDIRRKVFGEVHAATAATYQNLGALLVGQRQFAAAEQMTGHALEAYRKLLGEEHASTASMYYQLARAVAGQSKHSVAELADRKALEIRRKLLGEEHIETAASYFYLALDLSRLGQISAAEPLDRKALEIRRKVLGDEHRQTALSYSNLAWDLHQLGRYTDAEKLDRKALQIRRKVLGEEQPDTATSYDNLGADLRAQGLLTEAEEQHRRALDIYRKLFGEQHPRTAFAYSNLGGDLLAHGQYADAELLLRKALAIRRKVFGEEGLDTIESYHNLAGCLHQQGQYAAAEQMDRKALALFQKTVGEVHLSTARSYASLAADLSMQGNFLAAEELQRKSLEIRRKLFGDEHPSTARAYNHVATELHKQKKHSEAERLGRKSLEIRLKVLGDEHPDVASSYNHVAAHLFAQGKAVEAEKLYRKSLEIDRKIFGEDHPNTTLSYFGIASCLYVQGNFKEAERIGIAAARSFQAARMGISFSGLARAGFGVQQSPLRPLAVVLARNGKPAEAWKYFEDDLGRGLFDDLAARSTRNLTDQERQYEEALQGKLAQVEKQLGGEAKIDPQHREALKRQHEQLIGEFNDLQAALQKKYTVTAGQVFDLDKIQSALPDDAAIVAWVDCGLDHWGVVVRHQGAPKWIELKGSGPDGNWRQEDEVLPAKVREILQYPDPNTDWRSWRDDLAKQRMRPLTEHLDEIKQIIVLPSASMAGIPIEALTDRYNVSYAPSGTIYAWLQMNRKDFTQGSHSLLALADPVFSKEQAQVPLSNKDAQRHLSRGALKPLPGTRGEAKAIAQLFGKGKAELLLGPDANGRNLDRLVSEKKLGQFRYLHFATHGFADVKGGLNSFLALTPKDLSLVSHDKLSASHILRTWQLNADLVTLSACTTALGEYQGGEGYVGFSQALFLSGAHTVVVSLWPVHDLSTTLLMERFYQNLLGDRAGLNGPLAKVDALAEARRWLKERTREEVQQRLMELGIVANADDLPGERPFEHPNFWAPFILVGDPGR
jgi:CHAT domain-containing protein